jgi:GNAT superfamily N-acetyltransferase
VIIRDATIVDASSIARVNIDTWKTTYTGLMPQTLLDSRNYQSSTLHWQKDTLNNWYVCVAEDEEAGVIGFAGGGSNNGVLKSYTGELAFIYIYKSYQHLGIGRKLAANVACKLKQQGHNSMFVWVLTQNPYKSFYEKLGGGPIAERQKNFGGKDLPETAYGWDDLGIFEKILKSSPT